MSHAGGHPCGCPHIKKTKMIQVDLGELQSVIEEVLDSQSWYLQGYINDDRIVNVVAAIYLNNNVAVEVTTRIEPLTIIATTFRVSVIIEPEQGTSKLSTYYKSREPLCSYESMQDDVQNILNVIDFCLLRLVL